MDEKMEAFRAGLHQLFAEFPVPMSPDGLYGNAKENRRELLSTLANWESGGQRRYIVGWAAILAVPQDRLVTLDALIFG